MLAPQPRTSLTAGEVEAVDDLKSLCNKHDGTQLKLSVPPAGQPAIAWMVYDGAELVGYCALDGDEMCGMVHPNYRRRGLGRALVEAASAQGREWAMPSLLIICERAAGAGMALALAVGAQPDFGEHHQELVLGPQQALPAPSANELAVSLRPAGRADMNTLIQTLVAIFDEPVERVTDRVESDMDYSSDVYYLAELEGVAVGALRVITWGDQIGIYAFGVVPEQRGKGIGRQMLLGIMRLLYDEGKRRFSLEVETDNDPAIRLYDSCGFVTTTTYEYYKLDL